MAFFGCERNRGIGDGFGKDSVAGTPTEAVEKSEQH